MKKNSFLINFIKVLVTIIIIIVLSFIVYVFRNSFFDQIQKVQSFYYVWKGDEEIKKNNFQEAIDNYKIALKSYPKHFKAIYNLGNIYFWYELYTAQSEKGSIVIYKYDKKLGKHIAFKQKVKKESDKINNAESAYLMATEVNPNYINAWINLGLVRVKKYNYVDALKAFEKATEAKPVIINIPFIFNNSKSINYNKAIAYYNKGEVYFQLASSIEAENQRRMHLLLSLKNFMKSDEIEPKLFHTKYNIAVTYQLLAKNERAKYNYCQAIKISPLKFQSHYNLGVLLREEQSYIAAADELKKAAMLLDLSNDTYKAKYFYALLNTVSFRAALHELTKINQNSFTTIEPPKKGIIYSVLIEPIEEQKKKEAEMKKEKEEEVDDVSELSDYDKMLLDFSRCVTDEDYYEIQQKKYRMPTDWIYFGKSKNQQ